jgi:hypothetical protein
VQGQADRPACAPLEQTRQCPEGSLTCSRSIRSANPRSAAMNTTSGSAPRACTSNTLPVSVAVSGRHVPRVRRRPGEVDARSGCTTEGAMEEQTSDVPWWSHRPHPGGARS